MLKLIHVLLFEFSFSIEVELAVSISKIATLVGNLEEDQKRDRNTVKAYIEDNEIKLFTRSPISTYSLWLKRHIGVYAFERQMLHKINNKRMIETNNEIVELICNFLDEIQPRDDSYKRLITYVEDRKGHDFRYSIEANKIKKMLNWTPRFSFNEGIRDTVNWYLENKKWFSKFIT